MIMNTKLNRLNYTTVSNCINIETGIRDLEWPYFIIYNQKFMNEITVLDNLIIDRLPLLDKGGPGQPFSKHIRYFPLISDKDERKWNINCELTK